MTKVMLVEDDPTMLSLLETLLMIEGFEVSKAEDFTKVLDDVRINMPNVILMDVHLEGYDGIEIVAALRAESEFGDISVIMSSGMDVREKCFASGANDFILKPYMPDELINKIKVLVGIKQQKG